MKKNNKPLIPTEELVDNLIKLSEEMDSNVESELSNAQENMNSKEEQKKQPNKPKEKTK